MLFTYNYTTIVSVSTSQNNTLWNTLSIKNVFTVHIRRKSAQIMLLLFANITFFTPLGTDGRMSVVERVASELPISVPTYAYALFSLFCNRRCDICRLSWKYTCMQIITTLFVLTFILCTQHNGVLLFSTCSINSFNKKCLLPSFGVFLDFCRLCSNWTDRCRYASWRTIRPQRQHGAFENCWRRTTQRWRGTYAVDAVVWSSD